MTTPAMLDDQETLVLKRPRFGRFFLPGPTEVRHEVLAAQLQPMIGHRGKPMEELIASLQPGLRDIFRTTRPVYISSSSATGLMEAAVRNGVKRRVLSLVNGAFSERFFRIAEACGYEADALRVPLGQAHEPGAVADALRAHDYDAVTVVHSETSTGVLNPIADIARVVHAAGDVVLLVDSVTGIAGTPVETDGWDLDFVLTGSQKALALPPGLALGVANDRMLARAAKAPARGVYFDLVEFDKYLAKNQTPNTPALSLFNALAVQLEYIRSETIEARWARHDAMARRCWQWVDEMAARGVAVGMLARDGFRSPTVSCITMPDGKPGSAVTKALAARGYTIASGYGELKDATIRIGHMGDHTVAELDALLAELATVLA
ncbi:MAG TPA: alanine--glyoxylate aminotransferase family protein [Gemmatimonadaceae bacterium]|jgi:predicted phosphoserine aminotransferase|nr:alanine--glyoxylate aminotransferase family protein [Gemmatimonadaceae bacterium]